jgi:hypothetical protein
MNGFERVHECISYWTDAGQYQLTNVPIVRCKDCAHMRENPLVGCGCICEGFGFPLPDRDGFCAWGETKECE